MRQKIIIVASAAIIALGATARQARAAVLPECLDPITYCEAESGGDCPSDETANCTALQTDPNCSLASLDCDLGGCSIGKNHDAAFITCHFIYTGP